MFDYFPCFEQHWKLFMSLVPPLLDPLLLIFLTSVFPCFLTEAYSGGLWGLSPPWTGEIYGYQGVLKPPRVLSPPPCKEKNVKPPPGKIPEYASAFWIYIFFYFKSSLSSFMISFLCFICLSPSFQSYLIGCMYGVCLRTPFINENKKTFLLCPYNCVS